MNGPASTPVPVSGDDVYLDIANGYTIIGSGCNAVCAALRGPGYNGGPHTLVLWGRLYAIEKQAKDENYSDVQLLAVRQNDARPILDEIRAALIEYNGQVLPKSPMAKAISYTLNLWEALMRYIENPIL